MKLSVVIPAFNPGLLLKDTIASCLDQGGVDLEIVVVNDGSTDGTAELLASFGRAIHVEEFRESHGSGAFGRNHGLMACTGDAVKFLDHDDVLVPGTLAREVAELEAQRADLVMSPWGVCSLREDGTEDVATRKVYDPPAPEDVLDAILGDGKTPFTAAVLYRKSFLGDLRWDREVAMYDDYDFFCRAALRAQRIARIGDLSYWWRLHGKSFQARIGGGPLSHFQAERTRSKIYMKLQPLLECREDFSPKRRRRLACLYYKGLRAFALSDPAFCRLVLQRMDELSPGFAPTPAEEPSRPIQVAMRLFGVRAFLAAYRAVRGRRPLPGPQQPRSTP